MMRRLTIVVVAVALVEDFGHRSLHLTTVNGKLLTSAFYEEAPRYSYYVGCSKGGQQGLMEAQRYPDDFDGIVAGDPVNNWTPFYAGAHLWYSLATLNDPESYIPPAKTQLLDELGGPASRDQTLARHESSSGCSWCRGWGTAQVGPVPIASTR